MTPDIEIALNECRQAWAEFFTKNELSPDSIQFKDRTPIYAWCLHHEMELETLYRPIENRIQYILNSKPKYDKYELKLRINLRPVSRENIPHIIRAKAEYKKAIAPAREEFYKAINEAWEEYEKAIAPVSKENISHIIRAKAEYKKAIAPAREEYNKLYHAAQAEYDKAIAPAQAKYKKAIETPHISDVLNHTWNGFCIYKEPKPYRDWK